MQLADCGARQDLYFKRPTKFRKKIVPLYHYKKSQLLSQIMPSKAK